MVAILMTLEGEYYFENFYKDWYIVQVAILMTLEGEYYEDNNLFLDIANESRNPHDIGRRILRAISKRAALNINRSQSS